MLIELDKNHRKLLHPFFSNMEGTFINTCLQGHMGRAWTDSRIGPSFGLLQVGDFCYISGHINCNMTEVLTYLLQVTGRDTVLLVPGNEKIGKMIQRIFPNCDQVQRYAFKQKTEEFDIPYLKRIAETLPDEYELFLINEYWYNEAIYEEWSRDLVSSFESSEDFVNRGIGVVITCRDEIVSGASSYSIYDGGIEIQVDTKPSYRQRGLACIASAALIIACRERDIYPSWDAANEISVNLATKLGYDYSHSYFIYSINK
ncbi:MAG: GCN5-related N-acetyltransferase [Anaerocolumna sp.]|jgi:hypothetical protein|nr:GCN5-related N-acetyltransferase [Anaerocolumna sp.]